MLFVIFVLLSMISVGIVKMCDEFVFMCLVECFLVGFGLYVVVIIYSYVIVFLVGVFFGLC